MQRHPTRGPRTCARSLGNSTGVPRRHRIPPLHIFSPLPSYLDLVVVAARHEQGLARVKVDAPDGAVVLVKPVEERAHAVVPELNGERERTRERVSVCVRSHTPSVAAVGAGGRGAGRAGGAREDGAGGAGHRARGSCFVSRGTGQAQPALGKRRTPKPVDTNLLPSSGRGVQEPSAAGCARPRHSLSLGFFFSTRGGEWEKKGDKAPPFLSFPFSPG